VPYDAFNSPALTLPTTHTSGLSHDWKKSHAHKTRFTFESLLLNWQKTNRRAQSSDPTKPDPQSFLKILTQSNATKSMGGSNPCPTLGLHRSESRIYQEAKKTSAAQSSCRMASRTFSVITTQAYVVIRRYIKQIKSRTYSRQYKHAHMNTKANSKNSQNLKKIISSN